MATSVSGCVRRSSYLSRCDPSVRPRTFIGQVRDGVAILAGLVPAVIHVMVTRPDTLWGDLCYPVMPC
jgi:hypothetical protein